MKPVADGQDSLVAEYYQVAEHHQGGPHTSRRESSNKKALSLVAEH